MNPQLIFFLNLVHKNIQDGHLDAAEHILRQAQKIQSKNSEITRLFGVIAAMRLDYEGALVYFEASLRMDPKNVYAHSNKGNALQELHQFQLALESYDKSIALDRGYAEAYNNKGNTFYLINKFEDAIECYKKAIALNPSYVGAYNGLGIVKRKNRDFTTAFEICQMARRLDPCSPSILSLCLSIRIKTCFWQDLTDILNQLYPLGLKKGSKVHPFDFMALIDEPNALCNLTKQYMADLYPARGDLGKLTKIPPKQKIRIAYFSGDFVNHAVSILMAGVMECHDHKKFEVYGFSYRLGEKSDEEMQARIAKSCDHFINIGDRSDKEIAIMVREIGVDIAIDLGGLTDHNRPGVFSYRIAPIQISYIGYLGTMGAPYYDYLIADETIIPPSEQEAYTEKIIYLPSYQANGSKRNISKKVFTREELGLPSEGFIYCCFNNSYKITSSIFDSWARILLAVKGSVLFLYADNEEVKKNLISEIEMRGVANSRLIFASRLANDEYLARYRVADLFLDTSPYNAGTTASDALWSGLPVLTFLGRSFSARMCGSILNAIGLPELVASSQKEYEDFAISIASDPERIATLKNKLAKNRMTTPLFDTELFTHNLELAYTKAYERSKLGLLPDHIH